MKEDYKVQVKKLKENQDLMIFAVGLVSKENTHAFTVEVSVDYYQEISKERCSPEDLVKKSFLFLLDKEPPESILREFELKTIENFFPEYKEKVMEY